MPIRFTTYKRDPEDTAERLCRIINTDTRLDLGSGMRVPVYAKDSEFGLHVGDWAESWYRLGTANNWDLFLVETAGDRRKWELRYRYEVDYERLMHAILTVFVERHGGSHASSWIASKTNT